MDCRSTEQTQNPVAVNAERLRALPRLVCLIASTLLAGAGCDDSDGGGDARPPSSPLILAAGTQGLEPASIDEFSHQVDSGRLGLEQIDSVYDLTTPAGEPFTFDVLSRGEVNSGTVRISVAHASDDGRAPQGGFETAVAAGVVPSASLTSIQGVWLDAQGDGFVRITLRGSIEREQIFAVRSDANGSEEAALVRLRVGAESAINLASRSGSDYPGVLAETTLYSSDSALFALPTAAVSGDRTTVVTYEGDRADPYRFSRFEMRLQHEQATDGVTGGATVESSPDSGHWRDHEIAALFNVLALVRATGDGVVVKLSFDRGASFEQTELLGESSSDYRPRLVQIAMAADYTLAVLFWRMDEDASSLILVEGRPSAYDADGSPERFEFGDEETIFSDPADVTPVLFGARYSSGGDLVIGYAFSSFERGDDWTWISKTENRCSVRLFGEEFFDSLVEEDLTVSRDPSVSLLDSGENLRIFYAYEARDGIRLRTSSDGGRTFSPPVVLADAGASMPSVFSRKVEGRTVVDVIYLVGTWQGTEIHLKHWEDYGNTAPEDYHLTRADSQEVEIAPHPALGPGAPTTGIRITQVAWLGYDAVLDGEEIVVVYDEETYDYSVFFGFSWGGPEEALLPDAGAAQGEFVPAEPPPLAPGLTEPVPAPDPDHRHQLKLLRLR